LPGRTPIGPYATRFAAEIQVVCPPGKFGPSPGNRAFHTLEIQSDCDML